MKPKLNKEQQEVVDSLISFVYCLTDEAQSKHKTILLYSNIKAVRAQALHHCKRIAASKLGLKSIEAFQK